MAKARNFWLIGLFGSLCAGASFVAACSGGDSQPQPSFGTPSRDSSDVGDPSSSATATAVDPVAARYGVAWWEGSVQDFSAADAYGNALPDGEDRYAIVFYGHASDGTAVLAGQLVVDASYADTLTADATMADVAAAFDGSDVYTFPGDPTSTLPDQDRDDLLASVIDSFASDNGSAASGGPSSMSLPPTELHLDTSSHGSAPRVTMITILKDAQAAGMACNNNLIIAGAVAGAESSLFPGSTNTNGATSGCPNGSTDRGVWQINDCYHPEVSDACAFDPACAATGMLKISHGGTSFNAWSTYKFGAYKAWVPAATLAYNQVCKTTTPVTCGKAQVKASSQALQGVLGQVKSGTCQSSQCGAGLLRGAPANACSGGATPSSAVGLSQYNPSKAATFADSHWSDGVGLCAEFTSRSLIAGGANMPLVTWVPNLVAELSGIPYDEYNANSQTVAGYPGDVVIYSDASGSSFCLDHSSDEYNCGHAGLVVQQGGSVRTILADFHNNAHYHLAIGAILGGSGGYTTLRVYHLGAAASGGGDGGTVGGGSSCACGPCAGSLVPPTKTLHPTSCRDAGPPRPAPEGGATDAGTPSMPEASTTPDAGPPSMPDASTTPEASPGDASGDVMTFDAPDPYYCGEHGYADGYYCGNQIGLDPMNAYSCSSGFVFSFGPCASCPGGTPPPICY